MSKHLLVLAASMLVTCAPDLASAQAWPSRPVRVVVGFPPGGMVDTLPRRMQDALSAALGQPVVIDNRPGGAGVVGVQAITQARDDHTIGLLTLQSAIYQATEARSPYDLRRDISGITVIATVPYVLGINASSPIKTTQDFLGYAKANPGKLRVSSPGVATGSQLMLELLKKRSGELDITHVPYKGMILAYNDVVAGHVDASIGPLGSMRQFMDSGKIRALGIATMKRNAKVADLPTLQEATGYPDLVFNDWYVVVGPASMPLEHRQKLATAMHEIMASQKFRESADAGGLDLLPTTPDEAKMFVTKELNRISEMLVSNKIKLE
jgi:tripartite-type tricarboxylate transporter receptor subunit TctC